MRILLLFLCIPVYGQQKYTPVDNKPAAKQGPVSYQAGVYDVNKLRTVDDVLEYQSLLHSCKMIKLNMKAIGDHRLLVEDAAETSIVLFLQGVPGPVARILLEDIKANEFNL
jgi:hypothetical protein